MHFPVSCAAAVQKPFERGVALLHSFWYEEAEKEFADIAKDDPKCAMAQWGLAMSQWHQLWNHPDAATTKKGLVEMKKAGSLHAPTPRERDYIAAMKGFYGGKGDFEGGPRRIQRECRRFTRRIRRIMKQRCFTHCPSSRPTRETILLLPMRKRQRQF